MSDITDTIDAAEANTILDDEGTDVVLDPVSPIRAANVGERTHFIDYDFDIDWDEFQGMTKRELWDVYLQEVVRRIIRKARVYQQRLGRKLEFLSFDLPVNTTNRRTTSIERNGVFIGIMARRHQIDVGNGVTQNSVNIRVRAEIGLVADEDPDYVEPVVKPKLSQWELFKGWNQ